MTLTSCSSGSGTTADDAGPATLRYGLSGAPTCADPAQSASNQTIYVARQVVDSLTDQDPETGEIVPWLAQSWEINPDATEFTFHLRDGVTFSDGTALTGESVKSSFDSVANTLTSAKAQLGASYLSGYVGTDVPDPSTAIVRFSAPNSQFLQASSTAQLGIVAASTTALSPEERCAGDAVVASGPFTYEDYRQDSSATLVRRDDYDWASEAALHQGAAHLGRIEFSIIPESGVRTGSLASGQLDLISDALPQDAPQIEGSGGRIETAGNPGIPFGIQPNVSRGVLADGAVRQALIAAIDRQELVDTVLGPQFRPADSSLASATPGHVPVDTVTFDQARARTILDDAGWQEGADGIRTKDGQPLSFTVLVTSVFAGNQAILELVQQQLRAVGIDLQIDLISNAEYTTRSNDGDYDAIYYNSSRADGDILRTAFALDQRNLNHRGPIPDLDEVLAEQLTTIDPTQRAELIARAQQLVIDNGLWIPTVELSQVIGAAPTVENVRFDASARLLFFDTDVAGR
nr:ABC transporter substrate-binding protein [Millisia brevis]